MCAGEEQLLFPPPVDARSEHLCQAESYPLSFPLDYTLDAFELLRHANSSCVGFDVSTSSISTFGSEVHTAWK